MRGASRNGAPGPGSVSGLPVAAADCTSLFSRIFTQSPADQLPPPLCQVTVADISANSFQRLADHPEIEKKHVDLTVADKISSLIESFDLVIGAVPGSMGFQTLKTIISSKKNVVDISFFPEDPQA